MMLTNENASSCPTRDGIPIPRALTLKLIRQFYVPVAERTYFRWMATGEFPKPDMKHGDKLQFWHRETIEAWYADYVVKHQVKRGA